MLNSLRANEYMTELPLSMPGRVFRSPMPFSAYDPQNCVLDLYFLQQIHTVVVLAEADEAIRKSGRDILAVYRGKGMDVIHLPVPDFGVPDPVIFHGAVEDVMQRLRSGQNIAIHCHAGIGRTGVFAACLARQILGLSGDEAVSWVRRLIPGAVENWGQVNFVRSYGE